MKTLTCHMTMTPAARKAMENSQPDDPKRVRTCIAKINLSTTAVDFVRAIPLPTRGLERSGVAAFVIDKQGIPVTDDSKLRNIQGIPLVIEEILDFETRTDKKIIAWSGAGNTAQ